MELLPIATSGAQLARTGADLRVDVADGVVTLSGMLSSHAVRRAASEVAYAVAGVREVVNRTTVVLRGMALAEPRRS